MEPPFFRTFSITTTVDDGLGRDEEAAERMLVLLLEIAPDAGAVVSHNSQTGQLKITLALRALDALDAVTTAAGIVRRAEQFGQIPQSTVIGTVCELAGADEPAGPFTFAHPTAE